MIAHYAALLNPLFVFRNSATGRFVTRAYAALHPRTTQRERIA